jgi:hypothetical protein
LKYFAWFGFALLCVVPGLAQCAGADDPYAEEIIRSALSTPGVTLSFTEKRLNTLGDRAAVGVIRVVGDESLDTPEKVSEVLLIIRIAFGAPRLIACDFDKTPKATLFLLKHVEILPASRDLIGAINETRSSILRSTAAGR